MKSFARCGPDGPPRAVRSSRMRHVARRLFTCCSVASLLLFVAACVLWVRSLSTYDLVSYATDARVAYSVSTRPHGLRLSRSLAPQREPGWRIRSIPVLDGSSKPLTYEFAGFGWGYSRGFAPTVRDANLRVPFWLIAALSAVLPLWTARRIALRRRWRVGLCAACGYDLRATPRRCPECGTENAG